MNASALIALSHIDGYRTMSDDNEIVVINIMENGFRVVSTNGNAIRIPFWYSRNAIDWILTDTFNLGRNINEVINLMLDAMRYCA